MIPNLLVLFKGLLQDPRVSRRNKAWLWFAVVWLVSPIDLIPEFIPFLGPLDDAIVAALVLRHVLRTTDRSILAEHWRGDPATLDSITRTRRQRSGANEPVPDQSRRLNQIPPGPFEKLAPSPQTATVLPVFVTSIAP